ncbi:hypothetical protein [Deferrisoma sp.]
MGWRRHTRSLLEVLAAQAGVLVLSGPLGVAVGTLVAAVVTLVAAPGRGEGGWGFAGVFALWGLPLGYGFSYLVLSFAAWRVWFRSRLEPGRFLLAWLASLALLSLGWVAWSIVAGYLR